MDKKRSICHCRNCNIEAYCGRDNWIYGEEYDPCCPNMKELRKQIMEEWNQYIEDSIKIHKDIL